MYMGIQGFTGVYRGEQRNTGVNRSIQGRTEEYRGLQEYTGVYIGIQGYTEVCRGTYKIPTKEESIPFLNSRAMVKEPVKVFDFFVVCFCPLHGEVTLHKYKR